MPQSVRIFKALILLGLCYFVSQNNLVGQGNFNFATACFHDETISQKFTGATEITTCAGDGTDDRIQFTISNLFMAFGYVVVDENDIIVSIGNSNFINFEMLPGGTLRVYAFSHFGFITGQVGDDLNTAVLSIPCFDLTDNFVTVNNAAPGSVTISTPDGLDEYSVCPGDGNPDEISFTSDGTLPNTAFVVTDADNVVLAINTSGTVDFDGAGPGICRVYAVNYSGTLMLAVGDDLDNTPVTSECGGVSQNFITVIREDIAGGTVSTADGETSVLTCPGDGQDDLVDLANTGGTGSNFTYLVTDENNVILAIPGGSQANFEDAGTGICRVWGLSYEGTLLAEVGDDAAATELADGCFALSDNFVVVNREPAEGGTIATTTGTNEVATCPGDGNADLVTFAGTGAGGGAYTLVVTDTNNVIIGLPTGNEVDFETSGVGICRVWGLSYQGDLLAQLGDNAATATLATSCSDLSDNFVTIIRTVPEGGTVSTTDGETELILCPGDGLADTFTFSSEGAGGSNFTFLVTDADNVILSIPDGDEVDFDDAPVGICRVWGFTYEGNLLAAVGDDAAATQLADGCFSLSDNFVTVNRIEPEGGTVSTPDGATEVITCPGDGVEDLVEFAVTGNVGPNYTFIVTDANGIILGNPGGTTVDFELAGPGNCRVYGVAFAGSIIAGVGLNINDVNLANGCFDLSDNFISIVREPAQGGTVSTEDGLTEITTCPNDGNPDVIRFDSTGTNLTNFRYLITDEDGVVLGVLNGDSFNFDLAGPGVCRVYGFGFEGTSLTGPGDTLGVGALATECGVLSDNFVTVSRIAPDGGTVSTEDGDTEIFLCPGDGIPDLVAFDSSGVAGGQFTYVVTDSNNIILGVPPGDEVDFELAGFGTCRLWGLAYQGTLIAAVGNDAAATQLATGCFDLSDNFVTVVRDDLDAGTLATTAGETEVFTCPGDGIDDLVSVAVTGNTGGDYLYVITDENNIILNTSTDPTINLEGAGEGVCRIWGLAYTGDILAQVGDDAANTDLASGCFSLSDNFVTVVRVVPVGGTIADQNGLDVVEICGGDDIGDVVDFIVTGASNGAYTFVVAQGGFILTGLDQDSFDFNNANGGTYEVYGLAYAGTLNLPIGAEINETDLASSCFSLTENFISVTVKEVDGCELSVVDSGDDIAYLCQSNPNDGFLEFFSCSSLADTNYQYVITTTDNVILFLMDSSGFDFGALPLPEARVWAISYCGNLADNLIGTTITDAVLADDCFDITDNFVTVINGQPEAGEISLSPTTPEPFCVVNGNGLVEIQTTSAANVGYAIVVTDPAGDVLQINLGNTADFNVLPSGSYLIYGISYTGNLTLEVGDNIDLVPIADNCFEVTTDPLDFFRADEIDGGIISSQFGTDTVYVCPGDGEPDIVAVNTTASGTAYRYLVTDENGSIIQPESFSNVFNFEDAPEGICRIYGYAFNGNITASFGQDIATAQLSDSCFALSENFITLIRQAAEGGTVATTDGDTTVTIDLDGDDTSVTVVSDGAADLINFAYVITDDQNIVLNFGQGPTFDFASAPAGVCRIWGLSYQGGLLAEVGDDAATAVLAEGCFDLSDNFVTVNRTSTGDLTDGGYDAMGTSEVAITAFPNPVSGGQLHLIIESENELSNGNAFLRDQNGRAYAQQFVPGGSRRADLRFDLNGLPSGLLIVQYVAGDELRVVRVMKQ